MRCEQARVELPLYIRSELDETKSAAIADHVRSCADCRREMVHLRATLDLIETEGTPAPPPQLRLGVLTALESERVAPLMPYAVEGPRPALKDNVLAAVRDERSPLARDQVVGRPWRLRAARVLAAAALVVGGVVVGALAIPKDPRDPPDIAEGMPIGHETQVLALQGLGPSTASVRHYRHDNFRITLTVEGYPATPADTHYAVWVRGPEGDVAVGTFRLQRADAFAIPFAVGVNPSEYPDFVVTLEPNDGDPGLDGEVVTRGRFDPNSVHHGTYDE